MSDDKSITGRPDGDDQDATQPERPGDAQKTTETSDEPEGADTPRDD